MAGQASGEHGGGEGVDGGDGGGGDSDGGGGGVPGAASIVPLRRPPRKPRGLGLGGPLAAFLRSLSLGSLAHGRGALIWARAPPTHTPAGPGIGHPEYTDTGGWLGVISASRARWSKRGGRGKRRASEGGKKKRILGREKRAAETGRLSVCLPALGAPAVRPPPQSEIHTKWRRGLDRLGRLRRDEGRGGRGT